MDKYSGYVCEANMDESKRSTKDKYEQWQKLSVTDRLDKVGASVQKVKDAPYAKDSYECVPKFLVGDPVVVCCMGLYYHAVVQKIEEPYDCPDLKKKVPLYSLKYPGWGEKNKSTDEMLVEYDLVGTTKHTVAHELLYAHYWNKYKLAELNKKLSKAQLKSLFELPAKTLAKLEEKWTQQIKLDNPDQEITFAQWIGMNSVDSR